MLLGTLKILQGRAEVEVDITLSSNPDTNHRIVFLVPSRFNLKPKIPGPLDENFVLVDTQFIDVKRAVDDMLRKNEVLDTVHCYYVRADPFPGSGCEGEAQ